MVVLTVVDVEDAVGDGEGTEGKVAGDKIYWLRFAQVISYSEFRILRADSCDKPSAE